MLKNRLFLISSIILFLLILIVWGLPYTDIGFVHDDFGILFHGRINSWQSIWKMFTGNVTIMQGELNLLAQDSFASSYYRPLCLLMAGIGYFFWGLNAYGYYLLVLFLHWLNAVVILRIFLWFVEFRYALLGTLFFVFHGKLVWFSRSASVLQDLLALLLLLPVVFAYKKFLETGLFRYHLTSAFLFFISMGSKETPAIVPFIVALFVWMFYCGSRSFWNSILVTLQKTWLFFVGLLLYMLLRIYIFGLSGAGQLVLFGGTWKGRVWTVIEYFKDLFGFSFFRTPSPWGKLYLLVSVFVLLLYLFVKSTKKKELFFLAAATLLLSWPSLILFHDDRYIYPALPVFILFLLMIFRYSSIDFRIGLKRFVPFCILGAMTLWGAYDYRGALGYAEKISSDVKFAVPEFLASMPKQELESTTFVFLGLPYYVFVSGVKQALALYSNRKDDDLSVFHVREATFRYFPETCEDYSVVVEPINNGYRLTSGDATKAFWVVDESMVEGKNYPISMGNLVINKKYDKWKAEDISVLFEKKYLQNDKVKFISWDPGTSRFKYLEPARFSEL